MPIISVGWGPCGRKNSMSKGGLDVLRGNTRCCDHDGASFAARQPSTWLICKCGIAPRQLLDSSEKSNGMITLRTTYIDVLKAGDNRDYGPPLAFARA
jgi:hypothetical protein